jgi:hypothetical protein
LTVQLSGSNDVIVHSPCTSEESPMQQDLTARTIYCYARAQEAREKAKQATSALTKAGYLAAEGRWLGMAESHECHVIDLRSSPKHLRRGEPERRGASASFSRGLNQEVFQQGYLAGWQSVRGADDQPTFIPRSPVFVGPMYMVGFSRGTRDAA